jgi:hypothetical protein
MRKLLKIILSITLTLTVTVPSFAGIIQRKDPKIEESNRALTDQEKRLGLLALNVETPVENQLPEQFFAGEAPQSFLNAQERFIGLKGLKNKIVERVNATKDEKHRVTVNIIDTGIDPTNDFAFDILDWKVENGKVVGVGKDHMSQSPWGIPQLKDAWVYAIGSEGLDNFYRIVNPIETPLKYLDTLNEKILAEVKTAIAAEPTLKDTFFTKINSSNTNMIGLMRLLSLQIDPKMIETLGKANKILGSQTNPPKVSAEDMQLFKIASDAWLMSPEAGLPDFFSYSSLEQLKGFSEFQGIISNILSVSNPSGAALKKLVEIQMGYFRGHHFDTTTPINLLKAYTFAKLSEQIAFKKQGTQIYNPANELYLNVRRMKSIYPSLSWEQMLSRGFAVYSNILKIMQQDRLTAINFGQTSYLAYLQASLPLTETFLLEGNKDKDINGILKTIEQSGRVPHVKGESSLIRKWVIRTKLPNMYGVPEMHGTHVGTTGEAYSERNYRASPSRIGLSYVRSNLPTLKEPIKKNADALFEWFQKPLVAKALLETLKKDGMTQTKDGKTLPQDVGSAENRKKLAAFVLERFLPSLIGDGSAYGVVGLDLHWNLIEDIKENAANKRTLSNLSLGGENSFPSRDAVLNTPEEKFGSKINFIFGEFQKYIVAEALATHGRGTLYVMAAGNSNNVGDGLSQVDYPADLRPVWLRQHNQDEPKDSIMGEKVPNVIIAMSANEDGKRSGFSNMIFTENAQFMARGENIKSGALRYSLATSSTMIRATFPEVSAVRKGMAEISPNDPRVVAALRTMNMSFEEFALLRDLIADTMRSTQFRLALAHNDQKAEISGTSMASPEILFMIAAELSKTLKEKGLEEKEAYGKAGFLPEDLIKVLEKVAKLEPIGTVKNSVLSVVEKQKYVPPSEESKTLTAKLENMRNSNILCIRFYGGR